MSRAATSAQPAAPHPTSVDRWPARKIDSAKRAPLRQPQSEQDRKPRVAFQGERGAYGDDAIQMLWGGRALPIASWSFDDVVAAIVRGKADYGVLPIENSIAGPISATRSLLEANPSLAVVDEIELIIRHALLAPHGASIDSLTSVASHPVALKQCGIFLKAHPTLQVRECYDTAGAAREVAAHRTLTEAAIAGIRAAERYDLSVLAEDVQDTSDNRTRFVVVTHDHVRRW